MKASASIAVLLMVLSYPACGQEPEQFTPLFNGRNLDGWQPVNTAPSTWTVKDGMLICSGKPIGELRTRRMYQNFVLEVEWRHLVPRGNAGIFVWADDITAKGQPFHRSIEVQVLENAYGNTRGYTTHGDIFPIHGAKMTPENGRGGSRAFPTENRSKPSPEWNHYRIVCRDGAISLAVNGKVVTRGRDCQPRKGYICLESEGGIVHYRNLRIRELPGDDLDEELIAQTDRGYRCLYTGVDLSGWIVPAAGRDLWKVNDWVLSWTGSEQDSGNVLQSESMIGDAGFIVDFRLKENSGPCRIQIRGVPVLSIDRAEARQSKLLAGGKGWNRLEGTLVGRQLSLTLNGKPLGEPRAVTDVEASGSLVLAPTGPIDFANIYIRTIGQSER